MPCCLLLISRLHGFVTNGTLPPINKTSQNLLDFITSIQVKFPKEVFLLKNKMKEAKMCVIPCDDCFLSNVLTSSSGSQFYFFLPSSSLDLLGHSPQLPTTHCLRRWEFLQGFFLGWVLWFPGEHSSQFGNH